MTSDDHCAVDVDLTHKDIQALDCADAVTAFFARLNYNTAVRIAQEPANLGIAADSTLRPIKSTELIADQDGFLQVYLFQVKTVTVGHTRALARAFRNRAGNFLLVLTSDYERIDFVLVEKFLPQTGSSGAGVSEKQTGVRPRVLTVPRRHPDRVHLRVLRRFTNTESDAFAQYDKLLSAFTIADWSEEYFNNRALFSDYYLTQRLTTRDQWREDPKPTYKELCALFRGAAGRWAGKPEREVRAGLIEPALKMLGFKPKEGKASTDDASEPDYRLLADGKAKKPLAVCLTYTWGRSLDGKDCTRDKDTPDENPGAVVVSVLEKAEAPWAMVTNGKTWRLYSARTHSSASNYYEIDLDEILASGGPAAGDPAEAFKYFWLLFRREAFEDVEAVREGETRRQPFLDHLLDDCHQYAKELGERLKERVFEHVFVHFSRGFMAQMRKRRRSQKPFSQDELDRVFRATLTFLYRALFLLYAEARDLLPVREQRGYWHKSIENLKREIAEVAGTIADDAEGRLKKKYSASKYDLYDRLLELCAIVDKGNAANNVPVYNGGLFITEPEPDDETDEAENARFLAKHKIPDFHLARGLDWLARDLDPKRNDLVPVDYKSLGVRQLGSIYEGLLEFKLRIAPKKMAVVKGKRTEEVIPHSAAKREGCKILKDGRGKSAKERVYRKGELYLENDKRERKATGSYYTPDHIVKYIVENAVGPVLQEKLDGLEPEFRKAERDYHEADKRRQAFEKMGKRVPAHEQVDAKYQGLVKEFFSLRVLDPAMGSGHFLVEAVDYITRKMIVFLNGFPSNPIRAALEGTKRRILEAVDAQDVSLDAKRLDELNLLKRHVLKGCIYGVDLNPMAVELAKVSLWLDCFTLGAPLSFLDHHLRCGNSLIGVTVAEARDVVELKEGQQSTLWGSKFAGLMLATDLMRHVGELSDVTSEQVRESKAEYGKAVDALVPYKRLLDFYTSQWFGNGPQKKKGRRKQAELPLIDFLRSKEAEAVINAADEKSLNHAIKRLNPVDREIVRTGLKAADERRFFHWELEFPEVFYGPRPGTERTIERLKGAGFDAVIGNPPYENAWAMTDLDDNGRAGIVLASGRSETFAGHWDMYVPFVLRATSITCDSGLHSFIVPDAIAREGYAVKLRLLLTGSYTFERWTHFARENVFDEVSRHCVIYVVRNRAADVGAMITVDCPPSPVSPSRPEGAVPQSEWLVGPAKQFRPGCAAPAVSALLDKIQEQAIKLGQYCYVMVGATVHSKDGESFRKADVVTTRRGRRGRPFIDGKSLKRYQILWDGRYLDYRRDEMYGPRVPELFESEKLLVRDVTDENERLVVAYDEDQFYCDHLVTCVTYYRNVEGTGVQMEFDGYPRTPLPWPGLLYTLTLVGSKLMSWYFRSVFATGTLQGSYSHTYPKQVRALPIRKIGFSTSESARRREVRKLSTALERVLKGIRSPVAQQDAAELVEPLLREIRSPSHELALPTDTVHDWLEDLGHRMTSVAKERRKVTQGFLDWLGHALQVRPDKKGNKGVDALLGRRTIRSYAGSQEKGTQPLPFEKLLDILKRNSARVARSLDEHFQRQLRERCEKSTADVQQLQARLAVVDLLIDQVVYGLYGLSASEVAVIEGKA